MVFVEIPNFSDYIWEKRRIEEIHKRLKIDSALFQPANTWRNPEQ